MRVFFAGLLCGITLVLAGCGGGPCAGRLDGEWNGSSSPGKLTLQSTCAYKYQSPGAAGNPSTGCTVSGTYGGPLAPAAAANPGTISITISDASGSAEGLCLAVGDHSLKYHNSESTLTINSGTGNFTFVR